VAAATAGLLSLSAAVLAGVVVLTVLALLGAGVAPRAGAAVPEAPGIPASRLATS
jgi:hypothetical protein